MLVETLASLAFVFAIIAFVFFKIAAAKSLQWYFVAYVISQTLAFLTALVTVTFVFILSFSFERKPILRRDSYEYSARSSIPSFYQHEDFGNFNHDLDFYDRDLDDRMS